MVAGACAAGFAGACAGAGGGAFMNRKRGRTNGV